MRMVGIEGVAVRRHVCLGRHTVCQALRLVERRARDHVPDSKEITRDSGRHVVFIDSHY